MNKRLVSVDLNFAFEQLFRYFIKVVIVWVLVIILPQISAYLFVHEIKLLDFLAARAQQVRCDVVKSLIMFDMAHIARLIFVLRVNLLVEHLIILLNRLFDSQSR